jgi:hypothetical protein
MAPPSRSRLRAMPARSKGRWQRGESVIVTVEGQMPASAPNAFLAYLEVATSAYLLAVALE